MADVVEEVAIRLTADGTAALNEADRVADEMERKGEEAGEAFSAGLVGQLEAQAGMAVRALAEEFGVSFQEAAEAIQMDEMGLGPFSAEEMAEFANALEQMEIPLTRISEEFQMTNDELAQFSSLLTGQVIPATEEESEFLEALKAKAEEYGIVLDEEMNAQLGAMVDRMEELGESVEGADAILEEMKAGILEQVDTLGIAEQQVQKVVDAYREMGIAIPNALQRDKIRSHVRSLKEHADQFSDVNAEANAFTDGLIEQGQHLQATEGPLGKVGGFLSQMGVNLGQVTTGLFAFKILSDIIQGVIAAIKEAVAFSLKFTDTSRDLAAAVRVNSVAGQENNMTYMEWQRIAEQIADETSADLQASYESVNVALRELGAGTELADDQIEALLLTGAKFDELFGVEIPGGIRQLTAFISTGYSQALQQLGLDIDKAAQNQMAMNMGLGTNIDKLNESQQEMVRYNLLMQELEKRTEGVSEGAETFADRLDDVDQRTQRAKKTLGDLFVPLVVAFKEVKANVFEGFTAVVGIITIGIQKLISEAIGHIAALGHGIQVVLDNIGKEGFWEKMKGLPAEMKKIQDETAFELLQISVKQATGDMESLEEASQGVKDEIEDVGDAIETTAEQVRAFIDAARDFDTGMEKIARKLQQSLDDIEETFRQRRAKAEVKYQRDLTKIDRTAFLDRQNALREFQIDEIRAREDHQRDIHQLEERYLLDLEDAVRDRDARRVLQLQRRFNLEKKQREEDYNLNSKRRKEDLKNELMEIAFARALRRQERQEAYAQEMADLAAQEQQRAEMARLRAARQEAELLESIKNRLLALTEAATGELAIEQEKLDALIEALIATYGEDGPWVLWHQTAVDVAASATENIAKVNQEFIDNMGQVQGAVVSHLNFLNQAAAQASAIAARIAGHQGRNVTGRPGGGRFGGGFQRGGTIFATGPTSFTAGEGRPEKVDITPLSQATGRPAAGFGGGGQDKIAIDLNVEASEMLTVEVADQTMSEIADIFVNISQRSFQGGRGA